MADGRATPRLERIRLEGVRAALSGASYSSNPYARHGDPAAALAWAQGHNNATAYEHRLDEFEGDI